MKIQSKILLVDHGNFYAAHRDVRFKSLADLVERELVRNELFDGQAYADRALEEVESRGVVLRGVDPRAYQVDFLVADVEVVVDGRGAAVHEEADLAHAAAALDKFPGVFGRLGRARALEHEVRADSVGVGLHRLQELVEGFVLHEVVRVARAEGLGDFEARVVAVDGEYVFDAERAQHGNDEESDGAGALNENLCAELELARLLGAFYRVHRDSGGFDKYAHVQRHSRNVEESGVGPDNEVLAEIAVEVYVVVREEPVDAAVFAEVRALGHRLADAALAAGDYAGDNSVAKPDGQAGGVGLDVFAYGHDFAGAFVPENHGAKAEGVAQVFVRVGAAHAAGFHFDEHFVVADFRDVKFSDFERFG